MISIRNHLSATVNDVDEFLKCIVQQMWEDLNPHNRAGNPMKRSLLSKAQNLIAEVTSVEYVKKVGEQASVRHLSYVRYLANSVNLKHIITAKPEALDDIIATAKLYLHDDDLYLEVDGKIESQPFGKILLSKLFNYERYRGSTHCHERYKALNFDQATCPYCNENSARIIRVERPGDEESIIMLYDIDHFYPKHMFPYLALSFYNHIPSCKTCNQTFKGSAPFTVGTHIHPYQKCFDSIYSFEFNHSILANQPIEKVKLNNTTDFPDKLAAILQLESRYQASTRLSRSPKLIEILSKRTHLLLDPALSPQELETLIEALEYFGVVSKKNHILSNLHSKFHRDIVKMFDVHNTLNLD